MRYYLCCILAAATLAITPGAAPARASDLPAQTGTLWTPYVEWEVENPSYAGNPFDVIARVLFMHTETGETRRTQMFYAGDDRWKFRFSGTRTGQWLFETASDDDALDGLHGVVTITPPADSDARGFLVAHGNRFAVQAGENGELEGRLYNVYMRHNFAERIDNFSSDPDKLTGEIDAALAEVTKHGFDAMLLIVANYWFNHGTLRHDRHSEKNPDLDTFRVIETIITEAHRRGLHIHIWAWGDEARRWTPLGVGGINGEPDKRLQRYIAARLGALPGWTLSYAFDLGEWVTPSQVRQWHEHMHTHLGWPRLLMARETREGQGADVFDLGSDKLDVFANDERPVQDLYAEAASMLDSANIPVLSERRFLHTRDDVWDMTTTRRALWEFTMAGGKGAIWGGMWGGGPRYPNPEQLRIHGQFWQGRFLLEFERANELTDGYALKTPEATQYVFYKARTDSIRMDLSAMDGAQSAVAVDTRGDTYREIDLGQLRARNQTWTAPHRSDWAIAVGFDR